MTDHTDLASHFTLVLAVTGHRVISEPERVRKKLDEVFGWIAKASVASQTKLRVISPLAEGADRLMAEAGLAAGAALHCPLPFDRQEYAKDFTEPASKAAYLGLLAKAERVLELGGDTERRDDAYAEVGRLLASRCDLLVAVWDGLPGRGKGGSADVVAEALRQGVLVVHVFPDGSRPTVLLEGQGHRPISHAIETLSARLDRVLTVPEVSKSADRLDVIRRMAVGHANGEKRFDASRTLWAGLFPTDEILSVACQPCAQGQTGEMFARADTYAGECSRLYQCAYWLNFLFGAIAVTFALIGARTSNPVFTVGELIAIVAIVATTTSANARNWHERWIEYRHLAEQLRLLRFLFPLGLALPRERGRGPEGQQEAQSWTDWLVRRTDIALGFPNAVITPAYLEKVRQFAALNVLEEQISYHNAKSKRMRRLDEAMHSLGVSLFLMTALICSLELLEWDLRHSGLEMLARSFEAIQPIMLVISGLAPAIGAAVIGVRNVGEYARLERRSKSMALALEAARRALERDNEEHDRYDWLSGHLEGLAAQLMSETAYWRSLVVVRRIELVG